MIIKKKCGYILFYKKNILEPNLHGYAVTSFKKSYQNWVTGNRNENQHYRIDHKIDGPLDLNEKRLTERQLFKSGITSN
jgi:hypothetical protein